MAQLSSDSCNPFPLPLTFATAVHRCKRKKEEEKKKRRKEEKNPLIILNKPIPAGP
jgi:hypothetical protein